MLPACPREREKYRPDLIAAGEGRKTKLVGLFILLFLFSHGAIHRKTFQVCLDSLIYFNLSLTVFTVA